MKRGSNELKLPKTEEEKMFHKKVDVVYNIIIEYKMEDRVFWVDF